MRPLFLTLLALQLAVYSQGQHADSFSRSIDSQARAIQALEDSVYRLKLQQAIDKNSQPVDQFLAEREAKEKRQMYIRVGAMVILLAALIYGFARKRKLQQNKPG